MSSTLRPYRPVRPLSPARPGFATRRGSVLWGLIAPANVLVAIWLVAFVTFLFVGQFREELLYFRFMASQENLRDQSTVLSFLWLGFALLAFVLGTMAIPSRVASPSPAVQGWSDAAAVRMLFIAFAVVASVAFLWLGVTVLKVGLGRLIALAASNNVHARELILNGAFPGGRIISNSFIGLAVFSAMLLARNRAIPLTAGTVIMVSGVFVISLLYLGIVPILTSGRINFFAALIASYIAVCIAKHRVYGVVYMPIALVLVAIVWTAKQYFSLKHVMQISVFDQSFQGMIFYIYNDMLNAMNVIGHLNDHYQWGYNSLRFIYFFTFTDGIILRFIGPGAYYLAPYVGGGEYPMLTAPYVDFGLFGLVLLFGFGAFSQYAFLKARSDPAMGALYGLVCASLLLSVHSSYLTLQDPVFSMMLVAALAILSNGSVRRAPRQ